ncbi:MAG: SDR family oxidoreductase [Gammaproteobacteria bacterium]|nr:SDR family oxidoreductase [Gammaproteobacteria bacterium]
MYQESTLETKIAFIAGGTSGINLGIALGLAAVGAKVAVLGRNAEKAQAAATQITEQTGAEAMPLSADVRDPEQVEVALAQVSSKWGKIDILVSGAAGNFPAPAIGISPKGFKTVVDIDLIGTYNVFHLGFKHINKNASLIAISAPQAVMPMPFQAHVCAAKAGINMLVKCLAAEWGPAGIRVNGISPGPIDGTEGMDRLAPTEAMRQHYMQQCSLRRFGDPTDIANAAIYLSCELGNYVNGTILTVDGGTELGDTSADCLSPPAKSKS